MNAEWPVAGQVDELKLASGGYLEDTVHDFRQRIEAVITAKNKKKGQVMRKLCFCHAWIEYTKWFKSMQ